jgi:hypothetical protein
MYSMDDPGKRMLKGTGDENSPGRIFATGLPAAVGGPLVRDLPDAVDPQQIVEVDPATGVL